MVPPLAGIDHVHVLVRDRAASVRWHREVLGLVPVPELDVWQTDGGPLTLADSSGRVHIALFERTPPPGNKVVIALGADAAGFVQWREHLARALPQPPSFVDHDLSLSLYFCDPDSNPYEITTYEVATARAGLSTSS